MSDQGSVFAPPATPPPQADLRAVRRFVLQRLLRVGANAAMLGLFSSLVFPGGRLAFFVGAGVAVLLWLPTSVILGRSTFYPRPPDPRFLGPDGAPIHIEDVRWTTRAQVGEYLLGSLPMPLILGWLAFTLSDLAQLVAVVASAAFAVLIARRATQALMSLATNEAAVDLAVDAAPRARRWAEALVRLPGRPSDRLLHVLGRARFRTGDVLAAVAALDRIRDAERWGVGPLRAQMAIAHGSLDEAEALGPALRSEDPAAGALVEALVDLHRGRAALVADRADELMGHDPRPDVQRTMAVLVAASMVDRDPGRARELLAEHGWRPDQRDWLRTVWPPVGEALGLLDDW